MKSILPYGSALPLRAKLSLQNQPHSKGVVIPRFGSARHPLGSLPVSSSASNVSSQTAASSSYDTFVKPKALIVADYNGTIEPHLEEVGKIVEQYRTDQLVVMINSGRPPSNFRKVDPAGLRVDFISTSNGSNLHRRESQQPVKAWLAALTPGNQLSTWAEYIKRKTRWDLATVRSTLEEVADSSQPSHNIPTGVDYFITPKAPDDAKFIVKGSLDVIGRASDVLQEKATLALRRKAILFDIAAEHKGNEIKHTVSPFQITKRSTIEHVLSMPTQAITHLITMGNAMNDFPMFSPKQIAGVPNTAIVCGDKPDLRTALRGLGSNAAHCRYIQDEDKTLPVVLAETLKKLLVSVPRR